MDNPTAVETQVMERVVRWIDAGEPSIAGLSTAPGATLRCPSASQRHGDKVLAVFDDAARKLQFLSELIDIPEVLRAVSDLDDFYTNNRLVSWCLTSGCVYWQGACVLGHIVSQVPVAVRPTATECSVTKTCRWHRENGEQVCAPCSGLRTLPITIRTPLSVAKPEERINAVQASVVDSC